MAGTDQGIRGRMADLYDVFVDWEGRLGREMPLLERRLADAGARRVLDAGCGTGRHVQALLDRGFDAYGADLSEEMLAQARAFTDQAARFFRWCLGEDAPPDLQDAAPFDAIVCLGNVWPQILGDAEVATTLRAFRRLVRPGGLVLMGLKAVAIRQESGNPYLPLLRRERDGRPLYFIRFVDFDEPAGADGAPLCAFHMVVVAGGGLQETEPVLHRSGRMRVWGPEGLVRTLEAGGLAGVRVSGSLGDPTVPPSSEDLFVHASVPEPKGGE